MPKVNAEYIEQKRNKILDAALAVGMRKPMYEVSMRDIIAESGLSQGGIYRYFSNIDDVYIALINRETVSYDVRSEVERIFASGNAPERVIAELFQVWKKIALDNYMSFGKIAHEFSTILANDLERVKKFVSNVLLLSEQAVFQEAGISYIMQKIQDKYFCPKIPIEDIIKFIMTSSDGILRDLILEKHYGLVDNHYLLGESPPEKILDEDKLVKSLSVAVVLLLGGDEKLM
jgi:AcrR family transcriptional regulator